MESQKKKKQEKEKWAGRIFEELMAEDFPIPKNITAYPSKKLSEL